MDRVILKSVLALTQTHAVKIKNRVVLLLLSGVFLYRSKGWMAIALLQSASKKMPLVFVFKTGIFVAQLRNLLLELLNANLLLLQQLLLGLDNFVKLLQIFGCLVWVVDWALHLVPIRAARALKCQSSLH